MKNANSLSFDLPRLAVIECVELDEDRRRVVVTQLADEHGCRGAGLGSAAGPPTWGNRG